MARKEYMTIRLPEELKRKLKLRAELNRRTLGAEVVYLIERALETMNPIDQEKQEVSHV